MWVSGWVEGRSGLVTPAPPPASTMRNSSDTPACSPPSLESEGLKCGGGADEGSDLVLEGCQGRESGTGGEGGGSG